MPGSVDQVYDVRMAFQDPHDVNFLLHLRKHSLVRDCDTFEDMVGGVVDGSRCPHEVDMREATLAEVLLDLHGVFVDRYRLTWGEGSLVLIQ